MLRWWLLPPLLWWDRAVGLWGFALEGALLGQAGLWAAVGPAALACHLRLPHCAQTFPLDGNMPEIAPLQIVFI